MIRLPAKISTEIIDYEFDFKKRMPAGDRIISATATVKSGGIISDNAKITFTNKVVTFWIANGTPGVTAELIVAAETAGGRLIEEEAVVQILD